MKDNFHVVLHQFIKMMGANVTLDSIEKYLTLHPDNNSLLSYHEALSQWNIENVVLKSNESQLSELPVPHVAFIKGNGGGKFTIVTKITEEQIFRYDPEAGSIKEERSKYVKKWDGVVLIAEANEKSGEKDFSKKRKQERLRNSRIPLCISAFCLGLFSLMYLSNIFHSSGYVIVLFALNLIGLVTCLLLLAKSINSNSRLLQKLCNMSQRVNCDNILYSKAAHITEWLSWSEAGFIFFAASVIALPFSFFISGSEGHYAGPAMGAIALALPFSFYSVIYQAKTAKTWCILCLTVMLVFWLEFITFLYAFQTGDVQINLPNLSTFSIWLLGAALPIGVWSLLKQNLIRANRWKTNKIELDRLKSNASVFELFLSQQKAMPTLAPELGAVRLGHDDAPHTLTVVSDLMCTPCAQLFLQIESLLEITKDINCQIVFASNGRKSNIGGAVAKKILGLDSERRLEVLRLWYGLKEKNIQNWERETGRLRDKVFAGHFLYLQNEWIQEAQIDKTPTVFFDGFRLPEMYSIADLENIVRFSKLTSMEWTLGRGQLLYATQSQEYNIPKI